MKKTDEIKVVRWTDYEEEIPSSIGGMGGWFSDGDRWDDYIASNGSSPHAEALRQEIIRSQIKRGGDWHQEEGVPVFNDFTCASFSFRGWGDFMAAVWSTEEDRDFSYMDFYMDGWGYLKGVSP